MDRCNDYEGGLPNNGFVLDVEIVHQKQTTSIIVNKLETEQSIEPESDEKEVKERDNWSNPVEFVMSCISFSVGLGNVWRFPFTAYENGGGAFLIPYLIVLLLIGKPLYLLEMILGQFSSNGCIKIWTIVPLCKGVGYAGVMASWMVVTYYCCLMALVIFYFLSSFQTILPWTVCDSAWATATCYNSTGSNLTGLDLSSEWTSSAEQFFTNNVLQKRRNIDDGIGIPEWRLVLCLFFSWIVTALALFKGVSSSGKVAYFTALFPYVVLIVLLLRGVTLDGAVDGILFFITPDFEKLKDPQIWQAAVTQCFFSLGIGFGPIIVNSSFNGFRHQIYRDATIVSLMDTLTSLLAGVTIFSILGNLAYETGKPIESVVQSGTGLAFISYPEAIAKFDVVPQLFAVLFFLMLFTLGVGTSVAFTGCVITIICDAFPKWKRWMITLFLCCFGFLVGLVYLTPGGQYVLDVVDFFGGGFTIFVLAMIEAIAISWIYGLKNFLRDVEFMLGIKLGIYWKLTWGIFIPISLLIIFIYSLVSFRTFESDGYTYPAALVNAGWVLAAFALFQLPFWAFVAIYKRKGSLLDRLKSSTTPTDKWGPQDMKTRSEWIDFQPDE